MTMMPTEEFLDEEPRPSSKGKRSSKESSAENRSSSKKRSSKKRSSKASGEDDRSSSNTSSKDKKTKKKSKERKSTRSSSKDLKSKSSSPERNEEDVKDRRSKSSSVEANKEDVNETPKLVGLAPCSRDSSDFNSNSGDFSVNLSGDFSVHSAGFTVRKGTDIEKPWHNFSNAHKMAQSQTASDESYGSSNQFDTASITSGFSMPVMQARTSFRPAPRESVSHPGAVPVAPGPGVLDESNRADRIEELLDRKFSAFKEKEEGGVEVAPAVVSSQVGAHYLSAMPARMQNTLDRKFNQFERGIETRAAQGTIQDPVHEEMNSFAPSYVADSTAYRISSTGTDKKQVVGDDDNNGAEDPREVHTAAMNFSAWNYGKGNELHSIAAPPPDILTNHLIDDQEFALSGIERKEMRLAAGLCVECGRIQTHEKIKYGPFQAFRRMEPLTTPGHVYKGYCLFCNNILDLRRYLQEPYLREQDLDGTLRAALVDEAPINMPSSDESVVEHMSKTLRIQVCLCIAVLAVIAGVVGLAVVFTRTTSATPSTGSEQSFAPTAAPGPLGWHQVGSDISETFASFGYMVAISSAGNRVAVSSPKADQSAGRADIFEFLDQFNEWMSVGEPFIGDFPGDQTGYGIDLSDDGNSVIVGYPGNGAGFIRVFRYRNNKWQQVGDTLVGETSGGRFGASVAINPDGSFIIVGAPYDTNDNGSEAGRARVFQLKGNQWMQVGSDLLGRTSLDHFGMSVAISDSGEVLAIGAPNNDDRWQNGGQVHMFQLELDTEGKPTWTEPLDRYKIFGDSEGQQFGTVVRINGNGDTVVSSAVYADDYKGTEGGGDPRVVYIEDVDGELSAEEHGYGFSAIPGTKGLGNSIDLDFDGTRVIASTLNGDIWAGKAMTYDIAGEANWYSYPTGVEFGGEKLGPDGWLGGGPSVTMSSTGSHFAIGYESIVVDSQSQGARPAVRVYFYGHGERERE